MKALRAATAALMMMSGSGCALFSAVAPSLPKPDVAAIGGEATAIVAEAERRGHAKCDPILTAEVGWIEERAMGGAVSVAQVQKNGALVMEGATATDPKALAEQVKESAENPKKRVTLPDGAKNDLTAYVSIVGRNLAKYSARPEIPWTFAVIENPTPNAFSAPGGYVVVTTGLLNKMNNEAQLAGVLAHEIGHIVHKHSIKRYREAKATQCNIATKGGYVVGKGLEAATNLLPPDVRKAAGFAGGFDNFNLDTAEGPFIAFVMDVVMSIIEAQGNVKEDEFEADATALELIAFAGYQADEYENFLTSLGNSGGGFSKHPSTSDRVAKLKALREGEMKPFASGTAKPDVSKVFAPIKK